MNGELESVSSAASGAAEGAAEALETLGSLAGNLTLGRVGYILLLIVGCVVVSRLVLAAVGRLLKKSRLDKSLHTFIRSVLRVGLAFLSILIVLDALGVEITSLVAAFSLIGLALSLSVQGVLSNVAGGIMLLWAKPFQVGDFVEVDGVTGTVKDVTLCYTLVDTTDNRLVYLTNKQVSEGRVVNHTAEKVRRMELTFSASYDAPVEAVKEAILSVARDHPKVLDDPAPFVRLAAFGSSAIDYHLRCWYAPGDYWDVLYDLNEGVKRAFDQAGLEMTYDHLNVHLLERGEER